MLLQEIFDYLTYGELANFSVGGIDLGGIQPYDQPKIITNLNLGLVELYKRFPLVTDQLYLQQFEHISTYKLHSDYAQSNTASTQPYKYIADTVWEPFTDNILKIDGVFNEAGDEYPINEKYEAYSVFTPSYNILQIPFSQANNTLSVVFRAGPKKLPIVGVDPTQVDVPIPDQLLEALVTFIVYKLHTSKGTGQTSDAGIYYNKFERTVALVKDLGLEIEENDINERLTYEGWV